MNKEQRQLVEKSSEAYEPKGYPHSEYPSYYHEKELEHSFVAGAEYFESISSGGAVWVKASERKPSENEYPAELIFRKIDTKRVLDVYSYWSDECWELNNADVLNHPVGTLVPISEIEWLNEQAPNPLQEEVDRLKKLADHWENEYDKLHEQAMAWKEESGN